MDVNEAIKTRSSVRHFTDEPVTEEELAAILEAGRAAPSGLNNQPWRFAIVRSPEKIEELSGYSKYSRVIVSSKVLIALFLAKDSGYNHDKDMHGIGACAQNMWLAAHSLGVGMCWIGEILNRREEVEKSLGVDNNLELMALLCFGRPVKDKVKNTKRLPMEDLIVGEF